MAAQIRGRHADPRRARPVSSGAVVNGALEEAEERVAEQQAVRLARGAGSRPRGHHHADKARDHGRTARSSR